MRRHRRHSIEFKREVAQAYLDGETLHGLAKQHDVDRSLIRLWARKYECGEFDAEVEAAKTLHEYEAKIAQLKRALRPSVIFRKVTNGFRSLWGAEVHAHARSVIGTGRLNGLSPHQAIARALAGQAILAA